MLSYNPLRVFLPLAHAAPGRRHGQARASTSSTRTCGSGSNTLLLLFAAFQVLAIGLLADLVVRVTKPRDEVDPAEA